MKYQLADGSTAEIGWDIDGWDWADHDYSWLSTHTMLPNSSFFIHGGYIRHQHHLPWGDYSIESFCDLIKRLGEGLEQATVSLCEDTGGGDPGFWVEGIRPPTIDDVEALEQTRKRRDRDDKVTYDAIIKRHPEWLAKDGGFDEVEL